MDSALQIGKTASVNVARPIDRSPRVRLLPFVLITIVVAVWISAPKTASAADPVAAKKLMGEALGLVKANKLEDAVAKIEQAQKHLDHPSIHFAKARVLTRMLALSRAEQSLAKCEEFELARRLQQAVAKQRSVIEGLKTQHGRVNLAAAPETARIDVTVGEDKLRATGKLDRWFKPSKIRIEISAPGYAPVVRSAELAAAQFHLLVSTQLLRN